MTMDKRTFLKRTGAVLTAGLLGLPEMKGEINRKLTDARPFPVYDLHTHRSDAQTAKEMVEKAQKNGIQMFGILENVAPFAITNDDELMAFYKDVKDLPCYVGLQPMEIGWSRNLSPNLIALFDYVLMDPQTVRHSNQYDDTAEVWEHDCYIVDEDDFMDINVRHYLEVLENPEPLQIFGWPLFLPPSIARDYYRLWTRERQEMIIEAARKRGVAIEINDLAHTPHAEFILKAKSAGLKFTFGSDTRDHRTFRLDYCKQTAELCGLTEDDFYIPVKKTRR